MGPLSACEPKSRFGDQSEMWVARTSWLPTEIAKGGIHIRITQESTVKNETVERKADSSGLRFQSFGVLQTLQTPDK